MTFSNTLFRASAALAFMLAGSQAFAATYYVDSTNGSNGNSGAQTAPFKDFYPLNKVLKPGDTAFIQPGTYNTTLSVLVSGEPGKPITFTGSSEPGKRPKIVVTGNFGVHIGPGVGWVNVKYLDVRSTDKNGIWSAEGAHHLVFARNAVHDCGGTGIGTNQADYVTIINNTIFRNSFTSPLQASGITLLWMRNYDNAPGFHNVIRNNVIYENANKVFKPGMTVTQNGNGIKIDDFRRQTADAPPGVYTGQTLIENNLVYNNGGRGIHVFLSDYVTIRTNTVYWNNWDPYNGDNKSGEIETIRSGNIRILNNIMYSHGGATGPDVAFTAIASSGGEVFADYNLTFGAKPYYMDQSTGQTWGSHNVQGDPNFVNKSTDPLLADLRVRTGSPALAIGIGTDTSKRDFLGDERSLTALTVGAFQNPVE